MDNSRKPRRKTEAEPRAAQAKSATPALAQLPKVSGADVTKFVVVHKGATREHASEAEALTYVEALVDDGAAEDDISVMRVTPIAIHISFRAVASVASANTSK